MLHTHFRRPDTIRRTIAQKFKRKDVEEDHKYGEGGPSQWVIEVKETPTITVDSNSSDEEIAVVPPPQKVVESIELSGDSDEEVVHIMDSATLEAAGKVQTSSQEFRPIHRQQKSHYKKKRGKWHKT